jgi:hypothetical protein
MTLVSPNPQRVRPFRFNDASTSLHETVFRRANQQSQFAKGILEMQVWQYKYRVRYK